MPFDPNIITALETELEWAHQLKPGGQTVDPARIAAIEEQIALHKAAARREPGDLAARPEVTDASNVSTDYRSDEVKSDAPKAPKETERQKADRRRAEAAAKAAPVETADSDNSEQETTDA